MLATYDRDGSGRLETAEWSRMRGDPRAADRNGDGVLTLDELSLRVAAYGCGRRTRLVVDDEASRGATQAVAKTTDPSAPPSTGNDQKAGAADASAPVDRRGRKFAVPRARLPQGLPEWFVERDADGDGQLTLAEFVPAADKAQRDEFAKLDVNGDGLLTADEYIRASSAKPAAATEKKSP